jgi:hypothetical protein
MPRARRLQLLLSDAEYETLKTYADSKQVPMAEIIRDYIKTLEKPSF